MPAEHTAEAWIDAVSARIEAAVVAATKLPPDDVFTSLFDAIDVMRQAPANRFVLVAPVRFAVDQRLLAGAGAAHVGFDSVWNLDVCARLGTDREQRSGRQVRDASLGLAALVKKAIAAVTLNKLADPAGATSPLREDCRPLDLAWNPRPAPPGWAWARVSVQVKMHTDLSGAN